MLEGDIAADGSFTGNVDHPRVADGTANTWDFDADPNDPAHNSKYAGNLYGPRDSLEAAGWWHLSRDRRDYDDYGSIIGSFGAICVSGCE